MPARPPDDESKIVATFVTNGHARLALIAMLIRRPRLVMAVLMLVISTALLVAGYTPPAIGSVVAHLPPLPRL